MSVRNLQIYLKKEGASYTKLLNEIRKDMAVNYLIDKSVSIDETAYILGFSETSAFYRAFKKWTGFTPREFRTEDFYKRKNGTAISKSAFNKNDRKLLFMDMKAKTKIR